jgi:hypothetical protein
MVGVIIRAFGLNRSTFRRHPAAWLTLPATAALLTACVSSARLPDCVKGTQAPTATQNQRWEAASPRSSLELAIDGSSSMLGLTGSSKASGAWKALLRGVSLAAAANGLTLQTNRIGSGASTAITNPMQAAEPCFFQGCGAYPAVTSSLDSLWKVEGLSKGKPPLRIAVTDLEVNNGDITKLVSAIRAHVEEGAVIGVLAVRLPFEGKVFNSQATVIHQGQSQRPIYLLATGARAQLHPLLKEVKTKAALAGVPAASIQLTFLDVQANAPTRTARNVRGVPSQEATTGLPIRIAGSTYSPNQNDYQYAKLSKLASGVLLSSGLRPSSDKLQPSLGLMQIEAIPLPGGASLTGISMDKLQIHGADLTAQILIESTAPAQAVRAFVPRGQLPEQWWIDWNRSDADANNLPDQTDGLLLLMTSLSRLMIEPGTTPAASLCLAFSH